LAKEIEVQRVLARAQPEKPHFTPRETSASRILDSLQTVYATHPAAAGRLLRVDKPGEDLRLTTDPCLVLRVLMNMVTNALEATPVGGSIRVWAASTRGRVSFLVWNEGAIHPDVAVRVFQRYFTTKPGFGRGVGTYSMKWLAEQYLKGEVTFTSTEAEGTTFRLSVPQHLPRHRHV